MNSKVLAKVVEYCNKHVEAYEEVEGKRKMSEDELKNWDKSFVQELDQSSLFELILAANYLNIKDLLDLTCQTVADMIKGKTPEEIRETFNIKNDFTPVCFSLFLFFSFVGHALPVPFWFEPNKPATCSQEEEQEVIRENQWAFE